MSDSVKVAVVGAGPGGLSAAGRAAELGISHVLFEKTPLHADTIQRYQKGKHVMAEPNVLPLRSPMRFEAGTREKILGQWEEDLGQHGVDVRYGAEVTAISGSKPEFTLALADGSSLTAEAVVFAIGLQGNLRKLGVDGEDLPFVQYQLDDPDEYKGEHIVVVGAGDAAIENAIALSRQNTVYIVNRRDEFARAKDGNLRDISAAIESGKIQCFYSTNVVRAEWNETGENAGDTTITLEQNADATYPGRLILNTDKGEARVAVNRIIARLGAIPPRRFVESCGIEFPSEKPTALPELSDEYESNVPGLYIIGALGGYPLIKQAMNQGYEVVEYLMGRTIEPADEPLLAERLAHLPFGLDVTGTLALMQERIPVFSGINKLQFRELILGSDAHIVPKGQVVFKRNDYTDTFFTILEGEVSIDVQGISDLRLGQGEFFGEMSLISGRRRSGTVTAARDCVLIESPRREINKLINSIDEVKRVIDERFIARAIQTQFIPDASEDVIAEITQDATLNQFKTDEAIFSEGDEADSLHLIRSGSVAVSRQIGGREIVTSYVAAGNYVGEMGLLGRTRRTASVTATAPAETISLTEAAFRRMLEHNPALEAQIQETMRSRIEANARMESQPESGDIISFLMSQGLGEATDVLLIDESLCVRCDNCEVACAETHGGTSRLDREAGPTFANVHVPTSCRHCEDPHCMTDCPPDAIRRQPNGEVFIEDSCIGCGNCVRNCPYDVIQMGTPGGPKPGLLSWLLFGSGPGPGGRVEAKNGDAAVKKAVKCDMCINLAGGPACVRACPTGAALRISPEQFVELVHQPEEF